MTVKVITSDNAEAIKDDVSTKEDEVSDEDAAVDEDEETNEEVAADDNELTEEDIKNASEQLSSETNDTAEDAVDDSEEIIKSQFVKSSKTPLMDSYTYNEDEIRKAVGTVDGVTLSGVVKSEDAFIIKMNDMDAKTASDVKTALADQFGQIQVISEDKVSASVGSELWSKSLLALVIAILLMLIYITFRFEL